MTEIAWAASHKKKSYSSAQDRKGAAHRGKKRALVAVANSLLQAVWYMLTHLQAYKELGPDNYDRLNRRQATCYGIALTACTSASMYPCEKVRPIMPKPRSPSMPGVWSETIGPS